MVGLMRLNHVFHIFFYTGFFSCIFAVICDISDNHIVVLVDLQVNTARKNIKCIT